MNVNPLFYPTLILAVLFFFFSLKFSHKHPVPALVISLILAVPGILYAIYYFHIINDQIWFYELRSFPYSELLASFSGLLAGTIFYRIRKVSQIGSLFIPVALALGIYMPYMKQLQSPLDPIILKDRWASGVCRQTSSSSCGPASSATLLKFLGVDIKESELAIECYTTESGTENWYISRAFRDRGFDVRYRMVSLPLYSIPYPSIAGVMVNGFGHFIPIIDYEDGIYVIGDPLIGREVISDTELLNKYKFTGFFMHITNPNEAVNARGRSRMKLEKAQVIEMH